MHIPGLVTSPLLVITMAALFGSLILTWVFFSIYRIDGKRYIRFWMYAWIWSSIRYAFLVWSLLDANALLSTLISQTVVVLVALMLMAGAYDLSGKLMPRFWFYGAAGTGAWVWIAALAGSSLAVQVFPAYFYMGVTYILAGLAFLRSAPIQGQGKYLTGFAFILWGIHQFDFPFLRTVEWFAPWGFLIAVVMQTAIATGTLLIHFQKTRTELTSSNESLKMINTIADTIYGDRDFEAVVQHALDAVVRYLKIPLAGIFALDESTNTLNRILSRGGNYRLNEVGLALPVDNSLSGLAVTYKKIVTSDDTDLQPEIVEQAQRLLLSEGVKSVFIVPLLFREQVVGTLNLLFYDERALTDLERDTLLSVGKTIGLAMVNARYVERIQGEIKEREQAEAAEREQRILAEALRDTAAALNSTQEVDAVLERILSSIERVLPNSTANVFLIDDMGIASNVSFKGFAERGLDKMMRSLRLPVNQTENFRWMVENRRALVIADTHDYPGWVVLPETKWIRSVVSAPICIDNRVIGFLNLDSPTPNAFSNFHAEQLQAFADQASIAIRNARLYDAIRRDVVELGQRVTERTLELERERAQLNGIMNAMTEGVIGVIFGTNPSDIAYRYINQATVQLLGYSAEEWNRLSTHAAALAENSSIAALESLTEAALRDGLCKQEFVLSRKDGSELEASVIATRLDGPNRKPIGAVTVIRDISQEKALQEQKARFVSNASHELRTPLTNLNTRLYLLRRQPEALEKHLAVLEQIVARMRYLVENLLDLSRFERGVIELLRQDVCVQELINGVVEVQQPEAERKGIQLISHLPPTPMIICGDSGRLIQVLTNLITNAINYTDEGGRVEISAFARPDGSVLMQVQDTGIGIPPEHLPHIFQPFYRANRIAEGAGLGLSISREIVELHEGEISVDSELGKGTRFTIRLKLAS